MTIFVEDLEEKIDHVLGDVGITRDNSIRRTGYFIEHTGRGISSFFIWNLERVGAEFKRAGSNFGDVSKYSD